MIRETRYAPQLRQPRHAHDTSSISLIGAGELVESAGTSSRHARAGDIVVKPRGVAHEDVYGESGAKTYVLETDEDVGPYRWLFGGAPAALFTRALLTRDAGIEVDLLAALIESHREPLTPRMRGIAERIAATDVSVADLAAELRMHPVALARVFRREHGCSMTYWRRQARVRRAAALLASTVMPLSEVALECGFADQSHLCRLFKVELGLTPRAYRALSV